MFNPTWVKGKTIDRIEMNYFSDGRGGRTANPTIHFTDGSRMYFLVDETEDSDYGVRPAYVKANTK